MRGGGTVSSSSCSTRRARATGEPQLLLLPTPLPCRRRWRGPPDLSRAVLVVAGQPLPVRVEGIVGVPAGDGEARPVAFQLGGVVPATWVVSGATVRPLAARRGGGASGRWRPLGQDLGPFGPYLGRDGPTISRDDGISWGEGCVMVVFG
jgi:hypothetical protein